MANKSRQSKQTAPRYASIMGQPHMLAYINKDEERMIRKAGGAGTPGPGGVPAYWTVTDPGSWGDGKGYEGFSSNSSNNNSNSSGGRNLDADNFAGSNYVATSNTGNDDSGTNADGAGVKADDDVAEFIHSGKFNDGNNFVNFQGDSSYTITEDNIQYYVDNPDSTITQEQYDSLSTLSKILSRIAMPLGLGTKAITELQRKGLLPGYNAGVNSTKALQDSGLQDTTGSEADNLVNKLIEEGASNEEINEALDELAVDNSMDNKVTALDAMSDAAFEGSNSDDVANTPENYFSDTYFSDNLNVTIDPDAEGTNVNRENYALEDQDDIGVSTIAEEDIELADEVTAGTAQGYNVEKVDGTLSNPEYRATAQTGTVTSEMQVDAEANVLDLEATSKGLNAVGRALNDFAKVDISRVIDTSTVQGKLLAEKLGEGNYVDSKSTILGQMEIISDEFKDSNGNPKIPSWAQATARNVQKTIAFKGMSGSAATAALANAMMESTLGVAEKEASFFQTLTVENLNNRQEALINKASVLSNMEMANLDARMTAAVQNAKSFLQMELTNLNNKQQTELLNTETRVDGLLEDARAVNAERLFSADAANDFTKFYDELATRIDIHRADTMNAMAKFNTGEINDNSEFQANLDLSREKFYTDLQYNIDLSNAKWRQSITLAEAEMEFDAAKLDAENMFDLTSEGLNRTWDREDAYFDYIWKSSETELERSVDVYKIDKEYETAMRKIGNEEDIAKGQADYEVFKLIGDAVDVAEDVWDLIT